jgi:hypothetical protein
MSPGDLGASVSFVGGASGSSAMSEDLGVSAWMRPADAGSSSRSRSPASSSVHSSPSDAKSILRAYMTSRASPSAVPATSAKSNGSSGSSAGSRGLFNEGGDKSSPSAESQGYSQDYGSDDDFVQDDSRDRSLDAMSTEAAKSYRDAKVSLRRVSERLGGGVASGSTVGSRSRPQRMSSRRSSSSRSSYGSSDDSI